jgi:hypothetical protein
VQSEQTIEVSVHQAKELFVSPQRKRAKLDPTKRPGFRVLSADPAQTILWRVLGEPVREQTTVCARSKVQVLLGPTIWRVFRKVIKHTYEAEVFRLPGGRFHGSDGAGDTDDGLLAAAALPAAFT